MFFNEKAKKWFVRIMAAVLALLMLASMFSMLIFR